MCQVAAACEGLQLFWFALRTTVFWVLRSVQVIKVVSAKALGDERAVSDATSKEALRITRLVLFLDGRWNRANMTFSSSIAIV